MLATILRNAAPTGDTCGDFVGPSMLWARGSQRGPIDSAPRFESQADAEAVITVLDFDLQTANAAPVYIDRDDVAHLVSSVFVLRSFSEPSLAGEMATWRATVRACVCATRS